MIPVNANRIPLRPLALGEKTGHHHSLCTLDESVAIEDQVEMYEVKTDDDVQHFLRVTGDKVALTHQEHKTHAIAPGEYEVVIQQENTDWGASPVQD